MLFQVHEHEAKQRRHQAGCGFSYNFLKLMFTCEVNTPIMTDILEYV